jgi:hypothetical protein
MTVKVSLKEFQRIVNALEPKLHDATVRGLKKSALYLEGRVVLEISQSTPRAAVDTGDLRNSVNTTPVSDGAIVSVDAPQAGIMENGRRPGKMPPLQPLMDWVRRHPKLLKPFTRAARKSMRADIRSARRLVGAAFAKQGIDEAVSEKAIRSAAFAIARGIAKNGIAPRHYFRKAWDRSIDRMVLIVNYEIAKTGWKPTLQARKTLARMFRKGSGP